MRPIARGTSRAVVARLTPVALALCLLATACGEGSGTGPLVNDDPSTVSCRSSVPALPWRVLLDRITEFGTDVLYLPSPGAKVTIESVRLRNVQGSLRIRRAVMIPDAAMGFGLSWGAAGRGTQYPAEWRDRRPLPAEIDYVPASDRVGYPPGFDGLTWMLVLGVTPGPAGGAADGVQIDYRAGPFQYTYRGHAGLGLYPTTRQCDEFGNGRLGR